MSSAILEDLSWDRTGKCFYLLDTFHGLDERYVSDNERAEGIREKNGTLMASGAVVLLDEYGYAGYRQQKLAMDAAAESPGITVASLPTGQGLMIKPETSARA